MNAVLRSPPMQLIFVALFWSVVFTLGCFLDTRPSQRFLNGEAPEVKHSPLRLGEPLIVITPKDNAIGVPLSAVREIIFNGRVQFDQIDATPSSADSALAEQPWSEWFSQLLKGIGCFVEILFCWTWTNLLLLCCGAAALGAFGRTRSPGAKTSVTLQSAIVKGVFVYLLSLTGQLVASGSLHHAEADLTHAEIHTDDAHYFRIAGAASFVAFSLGYHPKLLTGIAEHLSCLDDASDTTSGSGSVSNPPMQVQTAAAPGGLTQEQSKLSSPA